jgi:hypothetical protein
VAYGHAPASLVLEMHASEMGEVSAVPQQVWLDRINGFITCLVVLEMDGIDLALYKIIAR